MRDRGSSDDESGSLSPTMGAEAKADRRTARARRPRRVGGRASARASRHQLDDPLDLSEASLESRLVELAKLHGWLAYHTHDSRRSAPGFPDWILLRDDRLLAIELKSATGKPTEKQLEWLRAFARVRYVDALIVRAAPSLDELEVLLS